MQAAEAGHSARNTSLSWGALLRSMTQYPSRAKNSRAVWVRRISRSIWAERARRSSSRTTREPSPDPRRSSVTTTERRAESLQRPCGDNVTALAQDGEDGLRGRQIAGRQARVLEQFSDRGQVLVSGRL